MERVARIKKVFSTLVEVFLPPNLFAPVSCCLLHARGGVSSCTGFIGRIPLSSPRSWRCFLGQLTFLINSSVFSTLVEVFLAIFHTLLN